MCNPVRATTFLISLGVLSISLLADSFDAVCIGVSDGDTVTMLDSKNVAHKVRLAQIDAPEKHQAFGQRSKDSLARMAFNKTCNVDVIDIDKYRRKVATLTCEGRNVNQEQIIQGMAWAYRKYLIDLSLLELESQAKSQKLGIWSEPAPVPPWEWRKQRKPQR